MLTKNILRLESSTVLGNMRAASFHSSKPLNEMVSMISDLSIINFLFVVFR